MFYKSIFFGVAIAVQRLINCLLVWWDERIGYMVGLLFSLVVPGKLLVCGSQVSGGRVEHLTRTIITVDAIDVVRVLVANGSNEREHRAELIVPKRHHLNADAALDLLALALHLVREVLHLALVVCGELTMVRLEGYHVARVANVHRKLNPISHYTYAKHLCGI